MIPGVREKNTLNRVSCPFKNGGSVLPQMSIGRRGGKGGARAPAESRLLRRVRGSKMAAAEEDCAVSAEADRELEELLESKSPYGKNRGGRV